MSNYGTIGGKVVLEDAIDNLYNDILSDPALAPYFEDIDLHRVKAHVVLLIAQIVDEPHIYNGPSMRTAHKDLHIAEEDFWRVIEYLEKMLVNLQLSSDVVDEVKNTLISMKSDILNT